MGQVPVGVVGDGKVARHFIHYLHQIGDLPVLQWSRKMGALTGLPPEAALAGARTIFVLIKDDAIEPFLKAHPALADRECIHFSGALTTPMASSFHWLSSFGPELYPLAEYRSIPFITSTQPEKLLEAIPALPNPIHRIAECDRVRYHALCAMAGNFTTLLWLKLFEEFDSRLGLPPSDALPYMSRIVENLKASPWTALTGPLARRDHGTIQSHLQALDGDAYQRVYRAFAEAYFSHPEKGASA